MAQLATPEGFILANAPEDIVIFDHTTNTLGKLSKSKAIQLSTQTAAVVILAKGFTAITSAASIATALLACNALISPQEFRARSQIPFRSRLDTLHGIQ